MWKFAIGFLLLTQLFSISFAGMPSDLVLYMSFDKNTIAGDQVKDLSNNGNKGLIKGSPKVVAGHSGEALDFNGSSDTVEIVTSESLAKTAKQITMEAWVFTRKDGTQDVISKWDGVMNGIIHFEFQAGGVIRYCMRDKNDATIVNLLTPAGKLPMQQWAHIAETYDGKTARIYVNGNEVLNGAGAGDMRDNNNIKYWIGSMYATDRWFGGLIDEVRIWSKALTQEEIKKSIDGILLGAGVNKNNKLTTTWGAIKN